MSMRLAFISIHPAPYRDGLLKRLACDPRLSVDVYTEQMYDKGHAFWDLGESPYPIRPMPLRNFGKIVSGVALIVALLKGRYNLAFFPGFRLYGVVAMTLFALIHKRYGYGADTIKENSRLKLWRWMKRFLVRHADFVFVPGRAGKDFFIREYGVERNRIVEGGYALEGKILANEIASQRAHRDELRSQYGLTGADDVFLMVANMIPTRHYPILAQAFSQSVQRNGHCKFMICGVGPDLEKMRQYAEMHSEIVVVPGCSFDNMKSLYAIADVYVHGGAEPASTAIVIGAIAGLPILSSEAVGCAADVLEDGKSGVVVADYLSVDAWCEGFRKMMEKKTHWMTMGVYARELSRKLDVDEIYPRFVEKVLQA